MFCRSGRSVRSPLCLCALLAQLLFSICTVLSGRLKGFSAGTMAAMLLRSLITKKVVNNALIAQIVQKNYFCLMLLKLANNIRLLQFPHAALSTFFFLCSCCIIIYLNAQEIIKQARCHFFLSYELRLTNAF